MKIILLINCFILFSILSFSQNNRIVISDNVNEEGDKSAILDIISENKGFLVPRITSGSRDNINDPAESLIIYNRDSNCFEIYVDGSWNSIWCYTFDFDCGEKWYHGGYRYNTVKIGNQCWFAENLRYDNGCSNSNYSEGDFCAFNEDDIEESHGLLYQWDAAMNGSNEEGAQGLCPPGWRIPSHDDWTELEIYICEDYGNIDCTTEFPYDLSTEGIMGSNEGDLLKINDDTFCDDGPCNDLYGFSAKPAGMFIPQGSHWYFGYYGLFWTSTEAEVPEPQAWRRYLSWTFTGISRMFSESTGDNKLRGYSVRCLKNNK